MKIVSKDTVAQSPQRQSPKRQAPKRQKNKSEARRVTRSAPKTSKAPKASKRKPVPKPVPKVEPVYRYEEDPEASEFSKFTNRIASLFRFNITFKLSLGFSMRLIGFILFMVIGLYGAFTYYLYYSSESALETHKAYLSTVWETPETPLSTVETYLSHNALTFYIFDGDKKTLYASDGKLLAYKDAIWEDRYKLSQFPHFPNAVTYGTLDGQFFENSAFYALHLSRTKAAETLEATFPIAIIIGLTLLLSAARSSSRLARKHLKPIHTITEQVKDMSANNLSTRLNVSGTKDELKDLASTFNNMLDDIQQSYEREKQFVSDASHELRTPIAVIKGYGGMLKRWGKDDPNVLEESIDAIVGETDNMHSLVESLLFIARNDKGTLKMEKSDFNFSLLLEEIVKETHLIDTDHQIVDTLEENILLFGSCEKLKQAIRIFIDNSIKYTPNGGEIKVSLTQNNGYAVLRLSDNGIGISKKDLPHIFDRFYRADKSRTKMKENQHGGTGLGLSIAKIIIDQHRGKIKVTSELNVGTTFLIQLPIKTD